jgi:UDP-N-acetyl-D-mannosaminuronate dehydrogenase
VAEATKVIENTQITLFNELTKIFDKMVIDTEALMLELGYIFIGIEY